MAQPVVCSDKDSSLRYWLAMHIGICSGMFTICSYHRADNHSFLDVHSSSGQDGNRQHKYMHTQMRPHIHTCRQYNHAGIHKYLCMHACGCMHMYMHTVYA